MSIEVSQITKSYGSQKALDAVSFSIPKGQIVGFLGPNGAGKSTLMKILTTFLSADSGQAVVNGFDVEKDPQKVQKSVGYLPEHNPLYLDLYVREYLEFNAGIYGVKKNRIEEVIQLTGLKPEAHKKIGQLSKGYRQRVGLANALLHDPEVLILDEPTTGLDPNQLVEIRQVIRQAGKNKTVFLSTHIMQEVEAICDRVIIIDHGKIVADRAIEKLQETDVQVVEVEFDKRIDAALLTLSNLAAADNTEENKWVLQFETANDMRPSIFDFAQSNDLKILSMNQRSKNLETVFREMTGNKEA
ncbi:gliding motility-associated ABC transporter ATP-binding subunit GldA [Flavobacterium silvaticum]|uniref:Gliding motility-associated ABC transporter ATP-binding subunit GldA n=1 Tax=Flavobacterium silvaticum TaxID=1852020 RepID=A0A972FJR3_9FLAO|nr:gliding motility-associated ABC transporter ATP-binding subunit GldA [Flavobacterium silvaticum]NMH27241.1 gliding motility-associated ABC transporter ATP-binding subunit GldA [Flavobacterium silvaticum]